MFALKSYIKKTITANEQVIEWTLQKDFRSQYIVLFMR